MRERPLAYAVILPAIYASIIAMLIRLIFRSVAFEFRWRTTRWKAALFCVMLFIVVAKFLLQAEVCK